LTYDDLKEYEKIIIQHIIPLKEGANLVRKKPMVINPKMKPLVKIKLEKMNKDGIIFSVCHSDWISNLVMVRNNIREIHL